MSETKHTPGPWKYGHSELDCFWLKGGDKYIIDGCGCCGSPSVNSEADARLIAAAPELLEACEGLLGIAERHGWLHVAVNQARAAIAKAKGEQP